MKNKLYWKLAKDNLIRNRRMYLPYAIATAIMSAMFFIIIDLITGKSVANMGWSSSTLMFMMTFGMVIMGLFTVGYMFYLNSFLIKRRRLEFGLYGVLGLEKRHVCKIVRHEGFIMNSCALAGGLLTGTVFGKLIFMALMAVLSVAEGSSFKLTFPAYLITVAFFCLIFLLNGLYNRRQVRLANPIDLIRGQRKGEKKVRGAVPLAIIGVLFVGFGYVLSIFQTVSGVAIGLFWPAVFLVIAGTYCLFIGGSQTVLRLLKRNKRIYYKTGNFVSISGLLHRMKQNAAGLANICILSTMVLVTISIVCSLYFGREDILAKQIPDDSRITVTYDRRLEEPGMDEPREAINELAKTSGVTLERVDMYRYLQYSVILRGGELEFSDETSGFPSIAKGDLGAYNSIYGLYIITAEDYNAVTGESLTLEPGQIRILSAQPLNDMKSVDINGTVFEVESIKSDSAFSVRKYNPTVEKVYIVTADYDDALRVFYASAPGIAVDDYYKEFSGRIDVFADYEGTPDARKAFGEGFANTVYSIMAGDNETAIYQSGNLDSEREEGNALYGGLLFLGIYFALLFLVNTVMIMYFKQVSEGYEDGERYRIMQKVGMSGYEVKRTINKQVLTVFFLPLILALMHVFAAGNMIKLMNNAFVMTNDAITYICIVVTSVVFSLIYVIAFRMTARVYYRLVKW